MFSQEEIDKMKSWAANQWYKNVSDAEAIQILYDIASKDPESPYYNVINGNKKDIDPNNLNWNSTSKKDTTTTETNTKTDTKTDTSTTTNNNSTVTNEDTINWVTTEEQAPTSETSKEWNTINGTEDDNITITELWNNNTTNTTTKNINKSEAKTKYVTKVKDILWDKFKQISNDPITSNVLTEENVNEMLNKMWYSSIDDAAWDVQSLYKIYKKLWYDDKAFAEYFENAKDFDWMRQIAWSAWLLLNWLKMIKWAANSTKVKDAWKVGKLFKWLSKLWLFYWLSAAAWDIDIANDAYKSLLWYDWEKRRLDRDWNELPYWKQVLWWIPYAIDKTLLLWLPSAAIEWLNKQWIWKEVAWENTKKQQKKGNMDYQVNEKFKNSNTYKWITALDELAEDYWADERTIADTLMNVAIAVMNHYELWWWWYNNERFFKNFEYNPDRHNRFDKDSWESLYNILSALADYDEING